MSGYEFSTARAPRARVGDEAFGRRVVLALAAALDHPDHTKRFLNRETRASTACSRLDRAVERTV